MELHTHRGIVRHDELIGQPWGSQVQTHKGSLYTLLQPGLAEILRETTRNTQIMYPKDIGYVLVMMGIGPGKTVLEAGTGSGALTTALAWAVGDTGHVFSYEIRPEMQKLARRNLERLGMAERVTFKLRDIAEGFDEHGVDALFLDVQNAYDYLEQARSALKSGGFFGSIMPTTNQVTRLIGALYHHNFAFTEILEIILRFYKPVAERFRPTDRMVAHTGYLVFARKMLPSPNQLPINQPDQLEEGLELTEIPPSDEPD
jgi:tRNA (adenine57-N1/adenine58-N1)-methyltransferase